LYDGHYAVITSVPAFLNRGYFCNICKKSYNNLHEHRCMVRCDACFRPVNCQPTQLMLCPTCNRVFKNNDCFNHHLKNRVTFKRNKKDKTKLTKNEVNMCYRIKRCSKCGKLLYRSSMVKKHRCGYSYCTICKEDVKKEGREIIITVYGGYIKIKCIL